MSIRHCGFTGHIIGPCDRVVVITAPHSRVGCYAVWVKEEIFFNWFANRFIERLPGLRETRFRRDNRVRWFFNPEIFAESVIWSAASVLLQLLSTNVKNTPLAVCPILMPEEPLSLKIEQPYADELETGLFSPQQGEVSR